MRYIDLHIHTQASDGTDSPAEVVRKAARSGLAAIAITDHDTTEGLLSAQAEGLLHDIEIVRGCELSVRFDEHEVHILALYLPESIEQLENSLFTLREHRRNRNKIIVKKLQAHNVDICYDELLFVAKGTAVGRPHIARLLLEKGYVNSINEAFNKYLGHNCPCDEPKKLLEVEDIMHQLTNINAFISLAHPGLIKCDDAKLEAYIVLLKKLGLSALEAYHSEHDEKTTAKIVKLAQKHDLLLTGGSDYHGKSKPNIHLGVGKGNLRVGYHILEKIKETMTS